VVEHTMDVSSWLRKQLEETSPDLLRVMVKDFAEALMSADADAVCGAGYGERSPERVNRRNGYRERDWDTRVGSIELAVPKLREGSYFPDWLLQPRRRAEQAFVVGDRGCLPGRCFDAAGGEAGGAARRRADVEESGLGGWRNHLTGSSRTSAPGRWTLRPTRT
jgi:Transposase, Mutator family